MNDDLIKRSDALSAAGDMSYIAFEIRRKLRMIPSAEPKSGEWEEKETFCVTDDDPIISQWQSARCSECGKYHTTPYMYHFNNYNFCPNCGAQMKGADDETD